MHPTPPFNHEALEYGLGELHTKILQALPYAVDDADDWAGLNQEIQAVLYQAVLLGALLPSEGRRGAEPGR